MSKLSLLKIVFVFGHCFKLSNFWAFLNDQKAFIFNRKES